MLAAGCACDARTNVRGADLGFPAYLFRPDPEERTSKILIAMGQPAVGATLPLTSASVESAARPVEAKAPTVRSAIEPSQDASTEGKPRRASASPPKAQRRVYLLLALACLANCWPAANLSADESLNLNTANFAIYSHDGGTVVGRSHYGVEHFAGGAVVLGDNSYADGERDVERDTVEFPSPAQMPVLVRFEHSFFSADGSPKLIGWADLKSGKASCMSYTAGRAKTLAATLDFPPDTYAGATLLIALEYSLRRRLRTPIRMEAFDCAPGPKVVALEATVSSKQHHWLYYSGDLVQVEVDLNHGWLNLLFEPLLPKRHLWFDPHNDWHYVGGLIQRYFYGGPQVLLVRANHRTTESGD